MFLFYYCMVFCHGVWRVYVVFVEFSTGILLLFVTIMWYFEWASLSIDSALQLPLIVGLGHNLVYWVSAYLCFVIVFGLFS
jgi:hypothetical protein